MSSLVVLRDAGIGLQVEIAQVLSPLIEYIFAFCKNTRDNHDKSAKQDR